MRYHLFILLFIFLHLFGNAQNSSCVKAIVKNAATKEVVPFCLVGVYDAGFTCASNGTSDFDGAVKIDHLLPGKYFVIARDAGFVNDTTAIDLYGGQIMQIAINLKPIPAASTDSIIISYKSPDAP